MNDDLKGILVSIGLAIVVGGAFTQKMPHSPDEWWNFGWGFAAAVGAQYALWRRQAPDRKVVLTDQEREQLRIAKTA